MSRPGEGEKPGHSDCRLRLATTWRDELGRSRRTGSGNLSPFLIRHSAFHTMDHAWEMEDEDLSV
jgi:hypothetical protein